MARLRPSESTIRRALARIDADDLDRRLAAWMTTRVGQAGDRRVIAVDGKSLRGASHQGVMPHLLAAIDHDHGVVLGQRRVPDKASEITELPHLLAGMDITGAVVTADALHCQRTTAAWITDHGGHYVLTVKGNQPRLRAALKKLPWKGVLSHTSVDRQHGRRVRRTIKVADVPAWVDFPGAAQVAQLRRTRIIKGRKHVETVYLICSVPARDARPAQLAAWVCGHWAIENRLHWVRDVTFDEDRHQLRSGHAPQVMATLRNTAISLLRLAGHVSIAAAQRHHARADARPINLIATSSNRLCRDPALKPGAKDTDTDDFAGPYATDGRRSATRFVKFTHRLNGSLCAPRPTTCRVEARLDGSVSWSVLGTFTLYLGHMAHPETYITYRNSETPCSGEPEKSIDAWRALAETRGLKWMETADSDNDNGA